MPERGIVEENGHSKNGGRVLGGEIKSRMNLT